MKFVYLVASIFSGTLLAVIAVLNLAQAAPAIGGPRYVAPTGSDTGLCLISVTPCLTVQYAVDVAVPGEEIRIAAGIYTGTLTRPAPAGYVGPGVVTQTLYLTQTLTVKGGYSTDFSTHDPTLYTTTLDAQGLGRVVFIAGNITPTLQDLQMMNGNAGDLGGHPLGNNAGGGVYVITATTTLSNVQVVSNTVPGFSYGGGLALIHSPSTISASVIQNNFSNFRGGGLYLYESDALLLNNFIGHNEADNSGGLHAFQSSFTLSGTIIQENNALSTGAGLGIENSNYPFYQPVLIGNVILSNTLSASTFSLGGGLYLYFSDPAMSGNRIQGNTGDYGGGLYAYLSEPASINDVFLNNQARQAGSGVYLTGSQMVFTHPTLSSNFGAESSALYLVTNTDFSTPVTSTVALTNAIIVSHSVGITASVGNTATVTGILWFNNISGNTPGAGSFSVSNAITGTPGFAADGYHLTINSMALNRGVNTGLTTDIDGEARPLGFLADLGADEFPVYQLVLPLIQR